MYGVVLKVVAFEARTHFQKFGCVAVPGIKRMQPLAAIVLLMTESP
jgi:hypothetical protein